MGPVLLYLLSRLFFLESFLLFSTKNQKNGWGERAPRAPALDSPLEGSSALHKGARNLNVLKCFPYDTEDLKNRSAVPTCVGFQSINVNEKLYSKRNTFCHVIAMNVRKDSVELQLADEKTVRGETFGLLVSRKLRVLTVFQNKPFGMTGE